MINLPIQRMKLPWGNEANEVDCGVYTMCHMKTFMGQRFKDWNCGLTSFADKSLQELRVKYCKILLTTEVSNISKENLKSVAAWVKRFRHIVNHKNGK